MRASRCTWVVGLLAAVSGVGGCEAGRSAVTPSAVAVSAAPRVEAENGVAIDIDRGTFDITSRSATDLAIFANEHSTKFVWKGTLTEGVSPLDLQCPCAPGATVSIQTNWAGLSLSNSTLTWDGVTYTNIGGAQENTGGQFQLLGNIVMPPYRGQTTARVRTTFTMVDSFFTASPPPPNSPLRLNLTGGGTATAWLTWRPIPVTDLPQGYWEITRVLYKFKHQ
jgi:hypothetical protein